MMEQFLDYMMVEDRSVVEQTHEIHTLVKDLKYYSKETQCVLPDKFVVGVIVSKLPPSWRDFATLVNHRRQEFTIDGLLMLKRRREQKTHVGKELLVLLVPTLFKRTIPTRIRKSHRRTKQRLSRQPHSRRRRRELTMCAIVRITLLLSVRIAKARSLPTW